MLLHEGEARVRHDRGVIPRNIAGTRVLQQTTSFGTALPREPRRDGYRAVAARGVSARGEQAAEPVRIELLQCLYGGHVLSLCHARRLVVVEVRARDDGRVALQALGGGEYRLAKRLARPLRLVAHADEDARDSPERALHEGKLHLHRMLAGVGGLVLENA